MARKRVPMHRNIALLVLILFLLTSVPAYAQLAGTDTAPGESCAGIPTGATRITADANNDLRQVVLICNGTIWEREQFAGETVIGTGSSLCTSPLNGALRYNTVVPCMEFCDGAAWQCIAPQTCADMTPAAFNFSDTASATASAVTLSDILQITDIDCQVNVSVSGGGSPQLRVCSDVGCSLVLHDWTSSPALLSNNQYVQLRLTASAAGGGTRTALLRVGNTADDWNVTTTGGDCTVPTPAPGTICADGTVYAGLSPDGNVKMYTTLCDEGMSWNGAACTGSRVGLGWNNGNGTGYVTTGIGNTVTGEANTGTLDGLDSDSVTDGNQAHQAAQRCADLNVLGHGDWYLPAQQELNVLYLNRLAISNFDTGGAFYWSSSEINNGNAWTQRFSDGNQGNHNKNSARLLRCVRR
jgi:hypothetical protein